LLRQHIAAERHPSRRNGAMIAGARVDFRRSAGEKQIRHKTISQT
jgi:hypothetical protein